MSRWFRFYDEAMDDPKVLQLTDREFRLWVKLLVVASKNAGLIPPIDQLRLVLKARLDHCLAGVERLLSIGLIDRKGDDYTPHGWAKRQYKSDTSTHRVQGFRAKRNVSETPPDTDTDTDTDTDKKIKKEERASAPTKEYVFEGEVFNLTAKSLAQWQASFHLVPDMLAEVRVADAYYTAEGETDKKKLFFKISQWLKRIHDGELAKRAKEREGEERMLRLMVKSTPEEDRAAYEKQRAWDAVYFSAQAADPSLTNGELAALANAALAKAAH